jgi:hypothetical protein
MFRLSTILIILCLTACQTTSGVMDTGNGTYMISASTDKLLGGAAAANKVAYENANMFCSKQGGHAVVLNVQSRDVLEGSLDSVAPGGSSDLRFRCAS